LRSDWLQGPRMGAQGAAGLSVHSESSPGALVRARPRRPPRLAPQRASFLLLPGRSRLGPDAGPPPPRGGEGRVWVLTKTSREKLALVWQSLADSRSCEAGVSKLVEVSGHRPPRGGGGRPYSPALLLRKSRVGKGEPILKEACSQGNPEAQLAFKDLMIH